nr:hypothetical protein BaRGS_031250 [Batillaria attramentaria]
MGRKPEYPERTPDDRPEWTPRGFFQRAFADFRSKFVKEELEFKVVLCDTPSEMVDYIDNAQLTQDLGGDLDFDNNEWIEHRSAVEKFAQNADAMSASFSKAVKRFQELELPNEVHEMEAMIRCCMAERKELMDDFSSSTTHGNTLLSCIKGENSATPPGKLCHVLELERLLVQLDETKAQFDSFWKTHEKKMRQGLHLRQFEDEFKLIQFGLGLRIETLQEKMEEIGSSVPQVEALTAEFEKMEEESQYGQQTSPPSHSMSLRHDYLDMVSCIEEMMMMMMTTTTTMMMVVVVVMVMMGDDDDGCRYTGADFEAN